jgi:hypothetical protein
MIEIINRLEHFCNASGIDLDNVLKTFDETQRVDNMDVNEKYNAKIQILKNVLKQFLQAEGQNISEEHLEFIIKISNNF